MDITNIIIEPLSISQQFVVYGQHVNQGEVNPKGVVVSLDFKDLHEPQCKGADRPGESDSDYETWTPFDGRHGDSKCYLGSQTTYIRRKQESECFNGEELERQIFRNYCECSDMDYECDVGYSRMDDGRCVFLEGEESNRKKAPTGGLSEEQTH
jgi:Sortilin, neurotensin receptor 3, C-terminal